MYVDVMHLTTVTWRRKQDKDGYVVIRLLCFTCSCEILTLNRLKGLVCIIPKATTKSKRYSQKVNRQSKWNAIKSSNNSKEGRKGNRRKTRKIEK